ncbi:MAG: hypothetical protein A2542_02445 [Parcubacteria group bacterium RIFOXYD2_FULL_52_8]|nr:MAG: hypothetical protein A2542_02445 [Parcubacteria group bacterium RIFOXYD2_FULL_52_8]
MNGQTFLHFFTSYLFPEYCIGCGSESTLLCSPCLGRVPKAEDPPQTNMFSMFPYHHAVMKQAIGLLKYKNSRSLARVFGHAAADYLQELLGEEQLFHAKSVHEPWLILPIPLAPHRLKTRGYNQAELIGQALTEHLPDGLVFMDTTVLYRNRETSSQVSIKDRRSRLQNPRGSFVMRAGDLVRRRHVIILDDVITTGATMREAMRVVQAAGARRVLGFSIAH